MGEEQQIANKRIGVLGCTFPGALIFIEKLCRYSQQRFGPYIHPTITLQMCSLSSFMPQTDGKMPNWTSLVAESVTILQSSGCDLIVSPANSTQEALREAMRAHPKLLWIDITHPVFGELSRRKSKKALLLATDATLNSQIYHAGADAAGITLLTPEPELQHALNLAIVSRLVCGDQVNEDRELLVKLIVAGQKQGADCVVLGCTELCLLISDTDSSLPVVDSNSLLAISAINVLE